MFESEHILACSYAPTKRKNDIKCWVSEKQECRHDVNTFIKVPYVLPILSFANLWKIQKIIKKKKCSKMRTLHSTDSSVGSDLIKMQNNRHHFGYTLTHLQ